MPPKLTLSARRVKGAATPKAAVAKSSFKATGGSKFVLFLGDEGVILVHLKGKSVLSRHFIPDHTEKSLLDTRDILKADSKAPVFLVIDSMDQAYIQQTLPPVSSFSTSKLIKRRLDRDFGPNDIKGAILLGREKSGRKDWNFLMVSIERTPQLMAWLEFLLELPNRFGGMHVLAIETETILKHIDRSLGVPKEGTGSEWKFFVSHNKVGGFRQVILRHDKLIFTRMTQPIGESTPEVIAGNIEQEMSGTIEYMKRLGFNPGTGLDIYILAADNVRSVLDMARFSARNVNIMTPYEVSQALGIQGATQPSDQFGDVVLASCVGASSKHVLTLVTEQFKQQANLYQMMGLQRAAGALIALGLIGYIGMQSYEIYNFYAKTEDLTQRQSMTMRELDALQGDIKKNQPELEKTHDIIELYKTLEEEKTSPAPLISRIAGLVEPPVTVKSIDWSLDSVTKRASPPLPAVPSNVPPDFKLGKDRMMAVLVLEFSGPGMNSDKFKLTSEKLLEDFKKALPGFNIGYSVLPVLDTNDKTEINFSEEANAAKAAPEEQKPLEAHLTITGFVIAEGSVAPPPSAPVNATPAIPTPLPK